MPKNPNAKRYKKQTAFRLDEELMAQLEAFRNAHLLPPTRTSVLEMALRDFLNKHQPVLTKAQKAA